MDKSLPEKPPAPYRLPLPPPWRCFLFTLMSTVLLLFVGWYGTGLMSEEPHQWWLIMYMAYPYLLLPLAGALVILIAGSLPWTRELCTRQDLCLVLLGVNHYLLPWAFPLANPGFLQFGGAIIFIVLMAVRLVGDVALIVFVRKLAPCGLFARKEGHQDFS